MQRESPGSRPSILEVDAQALIDKYKGTGNIIPPNAGSNYPREIVRADNSIGKSWVKSLQKYVETDTFTIVYSSSGAHIFPIGRRN
jgi:hypothetical protein